MPALSARKAVAAGRPIRCLADMTGASLIPGALFFSQLPLFLFQYVQ
jgi:hypothetical protein